MTLTSSLQQATSTMAFKVVCGGAIALGATTALAGFTAPTLAAERIELTYQTTTVTVSSDEIQEFAATGVVPADLQAFFDETAQVPETVRSLLVRNIRLPKFVGPFLESPTGEFALLQLDQAINSSSDQEGLDNLRTAFASAGEDRDFSMLELLHTYPGRDVRLNLTGLEGTYNRVSNFVERVQPALDTAVGFLQDMVCDCETAPITDGDATDDSQANVPTEGVYASASADCNGLTAINHTPPVAQVSDQ